MCVRMALSCVFCAADHEAHLAHDATMETYRAPRGALGQVREGTSSQERGSGSTQDIHRGSEDGSSDRFGRQLSMEEARNRSLDSIRRNSDEMARRQDSFSARQSRPPVPKCLEPMPPPIIDTQGPPLRSCLPELPTVPDAPESRSSLETADPLVLPCQR